MYRFLKKIFHKLTLKSFRDQLLAELHRQNVLLTEARDQQFLRNPVLVMHDLKIYLPLFYVDHIQKTIYHSRTFYERDSLEFLRLHYRQFEYIIDVGANIGNHMLYYCGHLHPKQVFCFEPNKVNRMTLERNIELNQLEKLVTVLPVAAGWEHSLGVQMNFSLQNTGMNRVTKMAVQEDVADSIEIRPLDSFDWPKVDFLKIDVEGSESDVLRGAELTISRFRPVIMVEVFDDKREQVETFMLRHHYQKLITFKQYDSLYVPA